MDKEESLCPSFLHLQFALFPLWYLLSIEDLKHCTPCLLLEFPELTSNWELVPLPHGGCTLTSAHFLMGSVLTASRRDFTGVRMDFKFWNSWGCRVHLEQHFSEDNGGHGLSDPPGLNMSLQ